MKFLGLIRLIKKNCHCFCLMYLPKYATLKYQKKLTKIQQMFKKIKKNNNKLNQPTLVILIVK